MTIAENNGLRAEKEQGKAFECIAYDAHCPSMTVRFRVPQGFPFAGGVFRIQRVRTATAEDRAKFGHLPDAPEMSYDDTELDALRKIAETEKL